MGLLGKLQQSVYEPGELVRIRVWWNVKNLGKMQELDLIEWFVGIKENYEIVYLMDCPECDVLITYIGQGHHCGGYEDNTAFKNWEAQHYAAVIQGLMSIYPLKELDELD